MKRIYFSLIGVICLVCAPGPLLGQDVISFETLAQEEQTDNRPKKQNYIQFQANTEGHQPLTIKIYRENGETSESEKVVPLRPGDLHLNEKTEVYIEGTRNYFLQSANQELVAYFTERVLLGACEDQAFAEAFTHLCSIKEELEYSLALSYSTIKLAIEQDLHNLPVYFAEQVSPVHSKKWMFHLMRIMVKVNTGDSSPDEEPKEYLKNLKDDPGLLVSCRAGELHACQLLYASFWYGVAQTSPPKNCGQLTNALNKEINKLQTTGTLYREWLKNFNSTKMPSFCPPEGTGGPDAIASSIRILNDYIQDLQAAYENHEGSKVEQKIADVLGALEKLLAKNDWKHIQSATSQLQHFSAIKQIAANPNQDQILEAFSGFETQKLLAACRQNPNSSVCDLITLAALAKAKNATSQGDDTLLKALKDQQNRLREKLGKSHLVIARLGRFSFHIKNVSPELEELTKLLEVLTKGGKLEAKVQALGLFLARFEMDDEQYAVAIAAVKTAFEDSTNNVSTAIQTLGEQKNIRKLCRGANRQWACDLVLASKLVETAKKHADHLGFAWKEEFLATLRTAQKEFEEAEAFAAQLEVLRLRLIEDPSRLKQIQNLYNAFKTLPGKVDVFATGATSGSSDETARQHALAAIFYAKQLRHLIAGATEQQNFHDLTQMGALIANRQYREATTPLISLLRRNSRIADSDRFRRYVPLLIELASAEDTEDVQEALEHVSAPVGSWRLKRGEQRVTFGGLVGVGGGQESLKGREQTTVNEAGLFLPVGFDISCPWGNNRTAGFFVSLFNLGNLTSERYGNGNSSESQVQEADNSDYAKVVSPGLYLRFGLGRTPFVIGLGTSYNPKLREYTSSTGAVETGEALQFKVFVAIDVNLMFLD